MATCFKQEYYNILVRITIHVHKVNKELWVSAEAARSATATTTATEYWPGSWCRSHDGATAAGAATATSPATTTAAAATTAAMVATTAAAATNASTANERHDATVVPAAATTWLSQ